MTIIELQQRREALLKLRADGVLSARFGEDEVRYRSDKELGAAIAAIDAEIAGLQGTRIHTFLPFFSKGF